MRRTVESPEFGHEVDVKRARENLLKDMTLYYALAQSGLLYTGSSDGMEMVKGNRELVKQLKEESPEGMCIYRQLDRLPNVSVKGLLTNLYDRRTAKTTSK